MDNDKSTSTSDSKMPMDKSIGKRISRKLYTLRAIQQPHIDRWRELSDFCLLSSGNFNYVGKESETKINTVMINNTALLAARSLAAGLNAGASSPSSPWVSFVVNDQALMQMQSVRVWLKVVEGIISKELSRSNAYNSLHTVYNELGVFGTGAVGIFEDDEKNIVFESYTIGSYYIAVNAFSRIDTFYRELSFTADDMVMKFGMDNLPDNVMKAYKKHDFDYEFSIIHAIEPNRNYKKGSKVSKYKKFSSTYIYVGYIGSGGAGKGTGGADGSTQGADSQSLVTLKTSGFDEFPIMCPRWEVSSGDAYGKSCPGIVALGDIKMLQTAEKMKSRAIEKMIDPPTVSSPSLGQMPIGELEAGMNIEVSDLSAGGVKAIYDVRLDPTPLMNDIANVERRIDSAFYKDTFQQMMLSDRREMTKAEVDARINESLLYLGPIITQLHNELLDPLIDRVFNMALRNNKIPPPPPELSGHKVDVEYISTLAKAQKSADTKSIERAINFIGSVAQIDQTSIAKLNSDVAIESYCSAAGAPPSMLRSTVEVQEMAVADAQVMAAKQQKEELLEMATVAPGVAKAAKMADEMGIDLTEGIQQ